MEQIQYGVTVVAHQHQGAMRQPATQLHDHLLGPVGDLLVPASLVLVVPRRGRQHGEHRQSPMVSHPGDIAQPHQGDPARTTGLDRMIAAGAYRVPVDPQSADPWILESLQCFVDAEDQGPLPRSSFWNKRFSRTWDNTA